MALCPSGPDRSITVDEPATIVLQVGVRRWLRSVAPYVYILPAFFLLTGFIGVPLLQGLYLGVTQGPILGSRNFVLFDNFVQLARETFFIRAAANTVVWTATGVLSTFLLGFAIALILNQPLRGRAIFRALVLIPWVVPPVVAGLTFLWMYQPNFGILNYFLYQLGLIDSYKAWLGNPSLAMGASLVALVWKGYPFAVIVLLAGLQAIPSDLYEAAEVDGANRFQRFRHVTLPLMRPTIILALILQTVWAFNTFDIVFVLTRGGPAFATTLLGIIVYQAAFEWLDVGYAGAVGTIMLAMMLLCYAGYMRFYGEAEI